ncbi:MAG: hypothetical protein V1870_01785 [Candidatus Aenigmatarchaeota archaeon]
MTGYDDPRLMLKHIHLLSEKSKQEYRIGNRVFGEFYLSKASELLVNLLDQYRMKTPQGSWIKSSIVYDESVKTLFTKTPNEIIYDKTKGLWVPKNTNDVIVPKNGWINPFIGIPDKE